MARSQVQLFCIGNILATDVGRFITYDNMFALFFLVIWRTHKHIHARSHTHVPYAYNIRGGCGLRREKPGRANGIISAFCWFKLVWYPDGFPNSPSSQFHCQICFLGCNNVVLAIYAGRSSLGKLHDGQDLNNSRAQSRSHHSDYPMSPSGVCLQPVAKRLRQETIQTKCDARC